MKQNSLENSIGKGAKRGDEEKLEMEDSSESTQELLKEKKVRWFRNRMMRSLMVGGMMGIVEACGMSDAEVAKLPETSIENVIHSTDSLREHGPIKTSGYPEKIGSQELRYLVLVPLRIGKVTTFMPEWITRTKEVYKLHENEGSNSEYIEMTAKGDMEVSFYIPRHSEGRNLTSSKKYELFGALTKVKDGNNKEKVIFEVDRVVKPDTLNTKN